MMDLYAKCGNNCGRCALYVENLTDEKRQWCAEGMGRYINWHPQPERLRQCAGCQAAQGFLYLKNCPVRRCAQHNGVENCAYCGVFPCQYVPTVSVTVDYRDQVAERLGSPIPEADYLAFIEPYEGMRHLQALRAALDPHRLIAPKPVPPLRTRMVDFPEAFSHDEIIGLRALHKLMESVLRARAVLYVEQMVLKKHRHELLNLFWAFGRYGDFAPDSAQLVIDGGKYGSQPTFKNIVRKRDNTLHSGLARSAELLQGLGVRVEHVPLTKQSWMLRMGFDEAAGGVAGLRALKRFAAELVEMHGEPIYAGNSRYKGEAYARFSKADMRGLEGHSN